MIDQAIKEQETSIALGIRAGTHVALPELVVPRAFRPPPIASSPSPELPPHPDEPVFNTESDEELSFDQLDEEAAQGQKTRGRVRDRKKSNRLTITVPAASHATEPEDTTPYCTCHTPSFGEVSRVLSIFMQCSHFLRCRWWHAIAIRAPSNGSVLSSSLSSYSQLIEYNSFIWLALV